ncbi:hypothetical protein IGI01_22425 [Bacillus thuringiensis]|nr:hypothetical protein [Bacillus thuringiensis]
MKKIGYLVGAFSLFFLITGCKNVTEKNNTEQSTNKMQSVEKEEQSAQTDIKFGKVTKIVGNELELKIGKNPIEEEKVSEEKSDSNNKGEVPAAKSSEAKSVEDLPKELEYTGEEMSLKVNAGVEVVDQGKKANLTAIKKGAIVVVEIDKKEKVKTIMIIN